MPEKPKPAKPMKKSWTTGREKVTELLGRGELEHVEVNPEHAKALINRADKHLATAHILIETDPEGAYTLLYDASRLALTAALTVQGLRPTTRGGHVVVGDALRAQRGPHDMVSKIFSRLRRTRHEVEYPDIDYEPVSSDEAEEALEDARYIVAQMKKFIPQLGAFVG